MRVLCLVAAAPSGGGASLTRVGKSFDSNLQHIHQPSNDIQTAYAMPRIHDKLQAQNMLHDVYVLVNIPNCYTTSLIQHLATNTGNRCWPKEVKSQHWHVTDEHLLSKVQILSYVQPGAPASIWLVCMQQAAKVRQDRPQAIIMPCRSAARGRRRGSASSLIHMLCSQPVARCMHSFQHSGVQYSSVRQVGVHAVLPLMPRMF